MLNLLAPAKINLFLHVTGKRSDGYHLLESLVCFADIGDEIFISPASNFKFEAKGEFAHLIDHENNSLVKAHVLMRERFKLPEHEIKLIKNLPVSAGIGGGSADAAALIKGLIETYSISEDVTDLALKIGADVPMCLESKPIFVSGIGEILQTMELPDFGLLLVNPGIRVSTAEVFNKGFNKFSVLVQHAKFSSINHLTDFLKTTKNDLESNALEIAPDIKDILFTLNALPDCLLSRMSGSGATCFGIFENAQKAKAAAIELQKIKKGWWIKPASLFKEI